MPEKIRRVRRRSLVFRAFAAAVVLTGLGLLFYPFLADEVYEYRTEGVIAALDEAADAETGEEKNRIMLMRAEAYNKRLRERYYPASALSIPYEESKSEEEEYDSLLSYENTGVMGYISIPCIDVNLPVYHGSSDAVLRKGAGHLFGSSLPIGGAGTHSVITAHTGFGKARFFTDLTQVKEGDCFEITVPGRRLLYRTDQIAVVRPEDTSLLAIEEEKDYCTLLTCTPYGINSHRLLVRGERVQEDAESVHSMKQERRKSILESEWVRRYLYSLLVVCSVMTGTAAVTTAVRRMRSV